MSKKRTFPCNSTIYFLDDWYREEEIMTDVHKKPENEEKTRKLGCTLACFLKKENLVNFLYYIILFSVYNT